MTIKKKPYSDGLSSAVILEHFRDVSGSEVRYFMGKMANTRSHIVSEEQFEIKSPEGRIFDRFALLCHEF
jgi:hypothetical protein